MKKLLDAGCRTYCVTYEQAQVVVLENRQIRLAALPQYGAGVIEYCYKPLDCNLIWRTPLWKENLIYKRYMLSSPEALGACYLGGWFEVFPCFGPGEDGNGGTYPYHGELNYLPWKYTVLQDTPELVSICFQTTLLRQAVRAEKILTIRKGSTEIEITLSLENLGPVAVPYHLAIPPTRGKPFLNEHCRIFLADRDLGSFPQEGSCINTLPGYENLEEGRFLVQSPDTGLEVSMEWDLRDFPCASVWTAANYNYGHHNHGGVYALCILPRDSLVEGVPAETAKWLQPGETWATNYRMKTAESPI